MAISQCAKSKPAVVHNVLEALCGTDVKGAALAGPALPTATRKRFAWLGGMYGSRHIYRRLH